MSPEEVGDEASAARMAWQMHGGWSATRVYLWWRSEYPLTSPDFIQRSLDLAEEMVATANRLRNLRPDQPILEAYERPLALDVPVGVRFAVQFSAPNVEPFWRTYALDVSPEATRAEVEEQLFAEVAGDLEDKYQNFSLEVDQSGRPVTMPINALFGPLPGSIP